MYEPLKWHFQSVSGFRRRRRRKFSSDVISLAIRGYKYNFSSLKNLQKELQAPLRVRLDPGTKIFAPPLTRTIWIKLIFSQRNWKTFKHTITLMYFSFFWNWSAPLRFRSETIFLNSPSSRQAWGPAKRRNAMVVVLSI